jgi:hypothetical protein
LYKLFFFLLIAFQISRDFLEGDFGRLNSGAKFKPFLEISYKFFGFLSKVSNRGSIKEEVTRIWRQSVIDQNLLQKITRN